MRKFLAWFFGICISIVVFAIGAYYLAKKYEEPVRNYILKEVNKRLQSPVHVSDINFSLLERFPSASLVMDSVWAEENLVKIGKADTLFFFRKVNLNLNLFDILDGQYKINEIETRDGFMRLKIDQEGYDNFHIWVENKDTTGFLLELDRVHIQNTEFSYHNLLRDQRYDILADELYFNGRFSDESYTMAVYGQGEVHDISIRGTTYLENRHVDVDTDLDITTSSERYAFRKGNLIIDKTLDFKVSGAFEGDGIDLRILGSELDIIKTLSLIPIETRSAFDDYTSSGELSFDCTLKGAFGKTDNPNFEATFSVSDGSIYKNASSWKLTDLTGDGSITNGARKAFSSAEIILNDLKGELNGDPFSSKFSVSNFNQPNIDGSVRFESNLEALSGFFNVEWMANSTGKFVLDASISTTLANPSNPEARDFLNSRASGSIQLYNADIKLPQDERSYRIDTASFSILNNSLEIIKYRGKINTCEIDLEGKADGFLNYFFSETGDLDVKGVVKTGEINLDDLFPTTSSSQSGVVVAFPSRANWDLTIISKAFRQGKFEAKEISGRLLMNSFKVEASALQFMSQSGTMQGDIGVYRFSENQFGIQTNFRTFDVDVKQLFETFNNFEQSFITSDVLEGRLIADISFQALCDSMLNIQTPSITSSIDLKISEGALVGFKPLISVADEIKKKPMLRLFISTDELRKRLEIVRFATLENEITILNGVVSIPRMEIKSSALNINVSGTHGFDNKIDYQLDFAFSELLELKDRKEPYNEFVQRDDEGKTRIYLSMIGTAQDFEVEVKRTDISKSVKTEVQEEGRTVRSLLKEEFGVFKNDTTLKSTKEHKPELQIEFDPEGVKEKSTEKKEVKDPDKKKPEETNLLNKLMKKTESDKKKLKDGEFEDDDF